MSKKRYESKFIPLCERPDLILVKEYKTESGMTVKRYITKKTPEEQKAFEEYVTRRIFEIISKYMED